MSDDQKQTLPDGHADELKDLGNNAASDAERDIRTSEAPFTGEENLGEQEAVGGSTPVPVGQDVGEMMEQATGNDPDPNMDKPKELNIDEEVSNDEKAIHDS